MCYLQERVAKIMDYTFLLFMEYHYERTERLGIESEILQSFVVKYFRPLLEVAVGIPCPAVRAHF